MSSRTYFSVCSTNEAWTFCKMNPLRFTSQIYLSPEKLRKNDNYFHSKWSLVVVLSENRCHFVSLQSFAINYFFLSLRKITWLNSQDFLLRTQNEALRLIFRIVHLNFYNPLWSGVLCTSKFSVLRKCKGNLYLKPVWHQKMHSYVCAHL